MRVRIDGTVVRGELELELAIELDRGVTMVSGPNGAGKTTLLRLIAGLEGLDSGTLHIADELVDEPAAGIFVPTHERAVAMAFQDHRLFPHLNVVDNVAFPLRRQGLSREAARTRCRPHVEAMGLASHEMAKPKHLSIGQRQRCALARALAGPAEVLLLDEPLASIDDESRADIRTSLLALERACVVWVTHDPADSAENPSRISIDGTGVRQTRS